MRLKGSSWIRISRLRLLLPSLRLQAQPQGRRHRHRLLCRQHLRLRQYPYKHRQRLNRQLDLAQLRVVEVLGDVGALEGVLLDEVVVFLPVSFIHGSLRQNASGDKC